MGHGLSSVVAWQTVAPVAACIMSIMMAKWMSHVWVERTVARTARVVARIGTRSTRQRPQGGTFR
jgi:hypothetical protein